jgi:hypothetical protein
MAAMPVLKHSDAVALAAVAEARFLALEDGRELARVRVAERDRRVDWFVEGILLDRLAAVVVQDGSGEAVVGFVAHGVEMKTGARGAR